MERRAFRLDFDRRLTPQFRRSVVTYDAGLLTYGELDDALGLSDLAGERLAVAAQEKTRHALLGMLPQAVFGSCGLQDVNDAERLRHGPAMQWIVGGKASHRCTASPSQSGRSNAMAHGRKECFGACRLSGRWIDKVHGRRPPRAWSSTSFNDVSPTYGEQGLSV